MNNTIYPEDYTDEDKAVYDDLMARGELLIGKKIAKCDAFLIEMAVKMTINQMKGFVSPDTPEEIAERKQGHLNAVQNPIQPTPEGLFNEGENPLEQPIKDYSEPVASNELHPDTLNIIS